MEALRSHVQLDLLWTLDPGGIRTPFLHDSRSAASSRTHPHPQPPPGTSGLNDGQPPPWRPPMSSDTVLLASSSTIPAAKALPPTVLPAPASAMPKKAAPPSVPAQAAAEPAAAPIEQQPPICIICHIRPPSHAFIHEKMAHLTVCSVCAESYIAANAVDDDDHDESVRVLRFCPTCRSPFTAVLPVYPLQNNR